MPLCPGRVTPARMIAASAALTTRAEQTSNVAISFFPDSEKCSRFVLQGTHHEQTKALRTNREQAMFTICSYMARGGLTTAGVMAESATPPYFL